MTLIVFGKWGYGAFKQINQLLIASVVFLYVGWDVIRWLLFVQRVYDLIEMGPLRAGRARVSVDMSFNVIFGLQLVGTIIVFDLALGPGWQLVVDLLPTVSFSFQYLLPRVVMVMMLIHRRVVVTASMMMAVLEIFVLLVQLQPIGFGFLLHLFENVIIV